MNRKPRGGKRFVKGQSGNPSGSSKRARVGGAIARLTAEQVAEVGSLILTNDCEQLARVAANKKASVLQVWTATLVMNSIDKSDANIFKLVLDRIVGAARTPVELGGQNGQPLAIEVASRQMSLEEMQQRADELAQRRKQAGDD